MVSLLSLDISLGFFSFFLFEQRNVPHLSPLSGIYLLLLVFLLGGKLKEVNILTDIFYLKEHENCGAGRYTFALAPNRKFYTCPAYFAEKKESVGDLKKGIHIENEHLLDSKFAPLCNECDTYQCENCVYINQLYTKEVNVSPSFQCKKKSGRAHV